MVRHRLTLLILAVLCVVLALASPASALTVSGGTATQQSYAREVVESCWLDWQWADGRVDEVDIIIEAHHEPYWEKADFVTGAAGLAWWGNIRVDSSYAPGYDSFFGEIVAHEWCHQIWYAMPTKWTREWISLCTEGHEGYDPKDWYTMPAENWAECARVALFGQQYYVTSAPRTYLNVISVEDTRAFVDSYYWGADQPFTDLVAEDIELCGAAGYLYHEGIIQGYTDNTVGPYQSLLRRHVALICLRSGLIAPDWTGDYAPATRADVRDAIYGLTWLEERWDEGLTRGQLLRLIYRTRSGD